MEQDIIAINGIDKEHLTEVIAEMKTLGSPTIKAVWAPQYGAWVALEGSHRIVAAKEMGLPVIIEEVEYSDIPLTELGIDDYDDGRYDATVADCFDMAYQSAEYMITVGVEIK